MTAVPDWTTVQQPGLVSVALCTFNGASFVDAQLASVLAQRGVDLEVVVHDDASIDDTWQRLQAWVQRDARVRAVRNPGNRGFAANFAQAISACRGEFIAPCDQDDIWQPDKLRRLLQALDGHDLSYCDSALVDASGQALGLRLSDRTRMYQGSGVVPLCFWNSVSGHAMVFRRRLLARAWPFPDGNFHDWWLAAVAAASGRIAYLDEPLVDYRQHARSLTDVAQRRKTKRDSWALFRRRAHWLQALAQLPGPDQAYCATLSRLWSARADQWFSPALVRHLAARAPEVMRLNPREGFTRFAMKQLLGQRWRTPTT